MLDSIDAGPKRRGPRRRGRARQKEIEELIAPKGEVVAQEPAEDLPEEPSED